MSDNATRTKELFSGFKLKKTDPLLTEEKENDSKPKKTKVEDGEEDKPKKKQKVEEKEDEPEVEKTEEEDVDLDSWRRVKTYEPIQVRVDGKLYLPRSVKMKEVPSEGFYGDYGMLCRRQSYAIENYNKDQKNGISWMMEAFGDFWREYFKDENPFPTSLRQKITLFLQRIFSGAEANYNLIKSADSKQYQVVLTLWRDIFKDLEKHLTQEDRLGDLYYNINKALVALGTGQFDLAVRLLAPIWQKVSPGYNFNNIDEYEKIFRKRKV